MAKNTTAIVFPFTLPVAMRTLPTISASNIDLRAGYGTGAIAISGFSISGANNSNVVAIQAAVSSATQSEPYMLYANSSSAEYIDFSAEL